MLTTRTATHKIYFKHEHALSSSLFLFGSIVSSNGEEEILELDEVGHCSRTINDNVLERIREYRQNNCVIWEVSVNFPSV